MASSYTTSLKIEEIATGDQSGTWGDTTNTNFLLFEQAITGVLSVAQGDTTLTLTNLDGALDQARNAVINLTGALTAGRNVVVPTANKLYLVKNSTTGGYAVTVKTAAGSGVAITAGTSQWVYCDGTNVVQGLVGGISGGTITDLTGLTLASGVASPSTNDAAALGTASLSWSDLFLASGALINWANGNVVLTHSSGVLTLGTGDLRITTAGTNAASVVTVGGTQTLTNKTMTAPVLGAATATSINKVALTQPATGSTLTILDGVTLTSQSSSGTIATLTNANQAVTGGAVVTSNGVGTVSSGTVTLNPGTRPVWDYGNNGAHTLAPGTSTGMVMLKITNGASAGAITTSGYTKVIGAFDTTNGHIFLAWSAVVGGTSILTIQPAF